jgi:hypothetical protein
MAESRCYEPLIGTGLSTSRSTASSVIDMKNSESVCASESEAAAGRRRPAAAGGGCGRALSHSGTSHTTVTVHRGWRDSTAVAAAHSHCGSDRGPPA